MKKKNGQPGNCTSDWSIPFSGSKRWTPLLPDMNATYWYYAITRTRGDKIGFRIRGQFGHARYRGFNVYNDSTGDLVWGTNNPDIRSSLRDVDIMPDDGSVNPYCAGVPRDADHRDYTVYLIPATPEPYNIPKDGNVITFPSVWFDDLNVDGVENLSLYLRVYLPDQDLKRHRLSGGVPLPRIEAFDMTTGAAVACPEKRPIPGTGDMPTGPGANTDGEVHFYRVTAADYYPNQDTAYLVTIFGSEEIAIGDTVAVIKIKPPTYTDTSDPAGITPDQTEVRYWSFDVNSPTLTNVTACLADYQAKVAKDGFVYVVLGRELPRIRKKVKDAGLNFLPWGAHQQIVLVYRQILPAFPYSAKAVPIYDPKLPREEQAADTYFKKKFATEPIGIPYAPSGKFCSEKNFLEDLCGLPVSDS
jgi:hypothetical protein